MQPKLAIIYLSFHSSPYIGDVISSLKKITYPKDRIELVIVDNPHPQHGSSVRFLEENVMPLSGNVLPHVTLLPQDKNLGFVGGNNVGIKWAIEHGFDYIYFHNQDGFVAANCLEPLVETMEKDKTIGAAQSFVMLHPETDLINTSGNHFHYLGIGFCGNFRVQKNKLNFPPVYEIANASGAAMIMRVDLMKELGLWDEDFFLYHEDIEYSFRLRAAGYKIVTVRDSIFYHKYAFGRNKEKFYFIERNRFGVMLMFFKWPTLLLFLPAAILLEVGLLLFAGKSGWLNEKLQAYKYWFNLEHLKLWLGKRARVQKMRKVDDREMIRLFTGKVIFEEKAIDNTLLRYIGNPLLGAYWWIVQKLIIW